MYMRLDELLEGEGVLEVENFRGDLFIRGITDSSKEVKDGYIFVARRGTRTCGDKFIDEALARGAVAILRETEIDRSIGITQIRVENALKTSSRLALKLYGNPEKTLTFIGVTGTNGKSSVSYFLKTTLVRLGLPAGYIGTLYYDLSERIPAQETTPSTLKLAPLLMRAVERGLRFIVMEVSSHALSQDRIYGLDFELGAFTNLSRDHLDYHETMENYYQAKRKLFTDYLNLNAKAVVSLESDYGKRLLEELRNLRNDLTLIPVNNGRVKVRISDRLPGLKLHIKVDDQEFTVETQLFGDYQAKNVGTLLGCALALRLPLREVIGTLKELSNPPGRLELCGRKGSALVFVDYAHTPDALEKALRSLLPLKRRRLIVLFGCGGERDTGKRPLMGKVAQELADFIILTSDNPRFEDPMKIIREIEAGLNGTKPYVKIPDREEAIHFAIKDLRDGDILLVAGKGHEEYQEIAGERIPFSDREIVKKLTEKTQQGEQ